MKSCSTCSHHFALQTVSCPLLPSTAKSNVCNLCHFLDWRVWCPVGTLGVGVHSGCLTNKEKEMWLKREAVKWERVVKEIEKKI